MRPANIFSVRAVSVTNPSGMEICTQNIRVTIIEPGVAETELADYIPHEDIRAQVKQMAQAMVSPTSEDVANAIIWALTRPNHVSVNEILIRLTEQLILMPRLRFRSALSLYGASQGCSPLFSHFRS
jgi:NADP-dependent 3-hydroxy acid dehydrogenase YdfG